MSYYLKLSAVALVVFTGMAGTVLSVHAQPIGNDDSKAFVKFKAEQSAFAHPTVSDFSQQQRFIRAALEVFIRRAEQVKRMVQTQTDIFPSDRTEDLRAHITQNIEALESYTDAVIQTQDTARLRAVVRDITAHRESVGKNIRRGVLGFYIAYFQKTIQGKINSRYQEIQTYIQTTRIAGKDTALIEKTFAPAHVLIKNISLAMAGLQSSVDGEMPMSLDETEQTLTTVQTYVSDLYDVFRKIAFQEKTLAELNTEERGIQEAFPEGSL